MNRRGFLQRAAMGVAALAVDPELLVWTPGKKTFFIPAAHYEWDEYITVAPMFDEYPLSLAEAFGYQAGLTVDTFIRQAFDGDMRTYLKATYEHCE